jgi:LacI family transcriptional regulator
VQSKRVTSFDVAREAGVSRTTVSLVLNNVTNISINTGTRERVLEAARKLNYHPDASGRKLVSGKSSTVGLVLQQSADQIIADAFLLHVMMGIEQSVSQSGFHVLLKPNDPTHPQGYTQLVSENLVDGIIVSGPRQDDEDLKRFYESGFPVVLMGQLNENTLPFVDVNAVEGAAAATRHLIQLGHRRIALITNASLQYTSAQQRRQGYIQALNEAGIPAEEALMREGAYTSESGFEAMQLILALPVLPTAVFVASDVVALGAMQAIRNAGMRIPEDMAVVGFDDIPMAPYFDPPLTTIRLPAFQLGWTAGKQLIALMLGRTLEQHSILLDSELVVRKSSGGTFAQVK